MSDYSVSAKLQAFDNGFTSTMKSALGAAQGLGSVVKSGLGFGILSGIGQQAFSTIKSGLSSLVGGAVETSDSMQKLQQAMRFSGSSEEEIQLIAGSTGTLKTYADKTVFSLQDVMSTFGSLSANGVENADQLTESVGNAVAVFGGGASEYSGVALAFSQAMASGALHAQDWNQIISASPQLAGGLRKELLKITGVADGDFKDAMEQGQISADDLAQAMNNIGMTDMAKDAATSCNTFEGAMGNLQATVSSGLQTLWDSFTKAGVVDAINTMNTNIGNGFAWIADKVPVVINAVKPFVDVLKNAASTLAGPFSDAFSAVQTSLAGMNGELGSTQSASSFQDVVTVITNALQGLAGFIEAHSETVATLITNLPKILAAVMAFKAIKAVTPFVSGFASGIVKLAGKGIGAIAGKLAGVASAEVTTGAASASSAGQVSQAAVSFLALGAGVALIAAGFWLLSNAAISLAAAGPTAVAILILLIGTIALLAVGAAALGTSLTLGAVGFVAFGIAIALVGVGALLAALALTLIANVLPMIITYGAAGAVAIVELSGSMMVFAGAAATAGAAALILGAGLIVGAVGALLFGVAALVAAAGMSLLGAATMLLSAGLLSLGSSVTFAAASMPLMLASALALAAALLILTVPMLTVGASAAISAVGMAAFAIAITASAAGMALMAAALLLVCANMDQIASDANSAETSLNSMESSVDVVQSGLDALGGMAKSAMDSLISAFSGAEADATQSANNLVNGVQSGINRLPLVVSMTIAMCIVAMNAGAAGTYNAGYNIGIGLVNGMESTLPQVHAVATQLAAEAQVAIEAKSKIGSPSKVMRKDGSFFGQGFVLGIQDTMSDAQDAAEQLVSIPNLAAMQENGLSISSHQELSSDYNYSPTVYVQADVTSVMDGREVGHGSAKYVAEKNTFDSKRKSRIGGMTGV